MTASDEEALPNARLEIATKGKAARETVRATMKVAREKEGQHRLVHSQRYKFLFLVMGLGTLFPYNMLVRSAKPMFDLDSWDRHL